MIFKIGKTTFEIRYGLWCSVITFIPTIQLAIHKYVLNSDYRLDISFLRSYIGIMWKKDKI